MMSDYHEVARQAIDNLRHALLHMELHVADRSRPTLLSMFGREIDHIEASVAMHAEVERLEAVDRNMRAGDEP